MAAFLNADPSFAPLRLDQRFGAVRSTLCARPGGREGVAGKTRTMTP